MVQLERPLLEVRVEVNAPVDVVWERWNNPDDITLWNSASPGWHTSRAVLDLRDGGRFCYRMETFDGAQGFDFSGHFYDVVVNEFIGYTMDDGRRVETVFTEINGRTMIEQVFEAEEINTLDMQRQGWQNILDSFRGYMDSFKKISLGSIE